MKGDTVQIVLAVSVAVIMFIVIGISLLVKKIRGNKIEEMENDEMKISHFRALNPNDGRQAVPEQELMDIDGVPRTIIHKDRTVTWYFGYGWWKEPFELAAAVRLGKADINMATNSIFTVPQRPPTPRQNALINGLLSVWLEEQLHIGKLRPLIPDDLLARLLQLIHPDTTIHKTIANVKKVLSAEQLILNDLVRTCFDDPLVAPDKRTRFIALTAIANFFDYDNLHFLCNTAKGGMMPYRKIVAMMLKEDGLLDCLSIYPRLFFLYKSILWPINGVEPMNHLVIELLLRKGRFDIVYSAILSPRTASEAGLKGLPEDTRTRVLLEKAVKYPGVAPVIDRAAAKGLFMGPASQVAKDIIPLIPETLLPICHLKLAQDKVCC